MSAIPTAGDGADGSVEHLDVLIVGAGLKDHLPAGLYPRATVFGAKARGAGRPRKGGRR